MMNYSFSTVLMTLITSTILMGIIALCFRSEKVLCSIGDKLIGVFFFLTVTRLLFPFELPFTRNIVLPKVLSALVCFIRHSFLDLMFVPVSLWALIEIAWIGIALYKFGREIRSYTFFNRYIWRYGIDVTSAEPYYSALKRACDNHKSRHRIVAVPGLDSPCQSGIFRARILMPEELKLSEESLYYTIRHELIHYRHQDYLLKGLWSVVKTAYWWNPLCIYVSEKFDLAEELRVDQRITHDNSRLRINYFKALTEVGEYLTERNAQNESVRKGPAYWFLPRAIKRTEDICKRANIIFKRRKRFLPLRVLALAAALAVYALSYCYIFEARFIFPGTSPGGIEVTSEVYAIELEDGAYDLYFNGAFLEHLDSLEYYPDMPVQ